MANCILTVAHTHSRHFRSIHELIFKHRFILEPQKAYFPQKKKRIVNTCYRFLLLKTLNVKALLVIVVGSFRFVHRDALVARLHDSFICWLLPTAANAVKVPIKDIYFSKQGQWSLN